MDTSHFRPYTEGNPWNHSIGNELGKESSSMPQPGWHQLFHPVIQDGTKWRIWEEIILNEVKMGGRATINVTLASAITSKTWTCVLPIVWGGLKLICAAVDCLVLTVGAQTALAVCFESRRLNRSRERERLFWTEVETEKGSLYALKDTKAHNVAIWCEKKMFASGELK